MSADAGLSAVILLILSVAFSWLVIYTAVRAAVGHALDRLKPRLVAEALTTPQGVDFVVTNVGTAAAFDVSARWSGRPAGEPLARTPMLGLNARLEWTLAAEPVPDEAQSVRTLRLDWRTGLDPSWPHDFANRAVLVPSRLDASR